MLTHSEKIQKDTLSVLRGIEKEMKRNNELLRLLLKEVKHNGSTEQINSYFAGLGDAKLEADSVSGDRGAEASAD